MCPSNWICHGMSRQLLTCSEVAGVDSRFLSATGYQAVAFTLFNLSSIPLQFCGFPAITYLPSARWLSCFPHGSLPQLFALFSSSISTVFSFPTSHTCRNAHISNIIICMIESTRRCNIDVSCFHSNLFFSLLPLICIPQHQYIFPIGNICYPTGTETADLLKILIVVTSSLISHSIPFLLQFFFSLAFPG